MDVKKKWMGTRLGYHYEWSSDNMKTVESSGLLAGPV